MQIKQTAKKAGLNDSVLKNISSYLKKIRAAGFIIKTVDGWELSENGIDKINSIVGQKDNSPKVKVSDSLRGHLISITNAHTRNFVSDAIKCFECDCFRAAVVLSWVGAISLLYDYVFANKLSDFDKEALRRDSKWKKVKSIDDFSRMKEYDFLQILASISVIGKNVKTELESCLKLRNGCGHPNTLKIGELRVSAHIEILILNIFSKY